MSLRQWFLFVTALAVGLILVKIHVNNHYAWCKDFRRSPGEIEEQKIITSISGGRYILLDDHTDLEVLLVQIFAD